MISMFQGKRRHKYVWIWKVVVIILGMLSLSSGLLKNPGFWSSYLLDIAGPAWGYVLLRARYKSGEARFLSVRFSPEGSLLTIVIICFTIETVQYFELYEAHFDPCDYLAYISGILIVYLFDKLLDGSIMDDKTD
jgi:hypothetical protein